MLALEQVRKSYDDGRTYAVDGVGFTAGAGELLVLLGESGCGKTTTLKMINRIIEPSSGSIHIDGRDVMDVDPVRLRRSIGYVIQGVGLFPHMTVRENVATVPRLLGWEESRIVRRVDSLLELVGLDPAMFGVRMPRDLSGGQSQRVGFARALAAEPTTMLLDEPFGALDPITRGTLQLELKRIQSELGFTAVLVTHDMSEALLLGDRIVVLRHGRVEQIGTPRELVARPNGDYVRDLMATPRRQADRLDDLAADPERES